MPFSDPIVGGGGELIRTRIRSENYVAGTSGWTINKDGSAEFSQVTVRGDIVTDSIYSSNYDTSDGAVTGWYLGDDGSAVFSDIIIGSDAYSISDTGDAAFETVSVNDSLTVGGDDVMTEIATKATLKNIYSLTGTTDTENAGVHGDMIDFVIPAVSAHVYQISIINLRMNTGAEPASFDLLGYYKFNGTASSSDTQYMQEAFDNYQFDADFDVNGIIPVTSTNDGDDLHIHIDFTTNVNGSSVSGISQTYIIVLDLGPTPSTIDSVSMASGGGTGTSTYVKEYTATATKAFTGSGSIASTTEGRQGYYSTNGNQKTCFQLPYATIQSDTAGSTIVKCEMYFYFDHWWYVAGGTAELGYHNDTDVAGAANYGDITGPATNQVSSASWPRNAGRWVDVGTTIGGYFRDGTAKGMMIGPGPTTSGTYYGKTHSHAEANPPKLRMTYTV